MEEGSLQQRQFLIRAGLIVGSGGLIFGYDIGVIAGTLSRLADNFDLSPYEEGLVVAILYVGSILGSIAGGPVCDYLGRWKTIHIQNFMFIIGSLMTGLATNLATLCIGRFIVGIASAVSGIADVPYLTEISPPQYRGVLSSQYEMAVSIGVLISFAVALALSGLDYGWRIAFLIPSAAALLQSAGMLLLPESPRWLLEKGLLDKTQVALTEIYGEYFISHCATLARDNEEVPLEVREFLTAQDRQSKIKALTSAVNNSHDSSTGTHDAAAAKQASAGPTSGLIAASAAEDAEHGVAGDPSRSAKVHSQYQSQQQSQVIRQTSTALKALFQREQHVLQMYQYPVYLIVVIQVLAQVTGGNVIRNYAPTIFENGGVSTTMSLVFNLLFGVVKTIFTFLSIAYIESTGRLTLLVYGIVCVGGGMLFLAICSLTSPSGNINNVPAFVIGCALVYAGFGLGYGPVPWVLSSEMFPTLIRGRIMSISLIASNIAQLVVNFLFLPMTEGITTAGTFFLFVALNVLTFLFAKKFLVETKEIAPEAILVALQERYQHSADKLISRWPAVCGPLVVFCCCASASAAAGGGMNKDEEGAPVMSAGEGSTAPGSPAGAGAAEGAGAYGDTVNPLATSGNSSSTNGSAVGSSTSKLTLLSVQDGGKPAGRKGVSNPGW